MTSIEIIYFTNLPVKGSVEATMHLGHLIEELQEHLDEQECEIFPLIDCLMDEHSKERLVPSAVADDH